MNPWNTETKPLNHNFTHRTTFNQNQDFKEGHNIKKSHK